jgi:hypothetical protein
MSLPEALERAASALAGDADQIRPANGDPVQLLDVLDADAAVRVLGWLLSNDADAADELASCWSEEPKGIAPLQQVNESDLPKPGRKVLRRTLHRMRSRGVDLEPREPSASVVGRLPELSDRIDGAFICPVDRSGGYLIFVIEPHPSGGGRLFQLALDEERGVVEFDAFVAGRSKLRSFIRKLQSKGGAAAVASETGPLKALLARLLEIHPADRALPKGFGEWRSKLTTGAGPEDPSDLARPTQGGEAGSGADERVAERIRNSQIGPWPPNSHILSEVGGRISGRLDKVSEMSPEERAGESEAAITDSVAGFFDEDHRRRTARRFELQAWVLWNQDREDEARDCLAAASMVRDAPLESNPVARAMIEVCFATALEKLRGEEGRAEEA